MNNFKTVFKFEFLTNVKGKVFIVSTSIVLVVITIITLIPFIISAFNTVFGEAKNENTKKAKAVYQVESGDYNIDILKEYIPSVEWNELTKDVDLLKYIEDNNNYDFGISFKGLEYDVVLGNTDLNNTNYVNSVDSMVKAITQKEILAENNFSDEEIEKFINTEVKSNVVFVGKDINQSFWVGYVMIFILYMSIILYGQGILMSVATEKSTKTMELLITSVKTTDLIFGKVFASASVALLQLLLFVAAAIIGIFISKDKLAALSPEIIGYLTNSFDLRLFFALLLFFLLGFFVYAFLYAGFGSTISKLEEANSAATIPMLFVLTAFFIAMFSMGTPNAMLPVVTSFVPFLSPFVMFMRICVTNVSPIAIAISILINILTVIFSGIFGARIYRAGVLMYGKSPSLITTLKTVFSKQ